MAFAPLLNDQLMSFLQLFAAGLIDVPLVHVGGLLPLQAGAVGGHRTLSVGSQTLG
ncbi:hypothetical protein D9M68_933760 [compost metagenome]